MWISTFPARPAISARRKALSQGAGLRAYLLLGKSHLHGEEYGDSIAAYEKALALDPQNTSAQKGLAEARRRQAEGP